MSAVCAVTAFNPFAVKGGGSGGDLAYGVAVDASKNVVVVGQFQNTATFGGLTATALGGWDGFVAKMNAAGTYKWVQRVGGATGDEQVNKVAVDGAGNIYITGKFSGTITLGSFSLASLGRADVFIAKLDPNGVFVWAKRAGSNDATIDDEGTAITLDSAGNVYVAGTFAATSDFGATSLISAGGADFFVTKLSNNGVFLSSWRGGGASNDIVKGIAVDGMGNVIVAGEFQSQTMIGANIFNATGGAGDIDIFVAHYNDVGVLNWALQFGGSAGSDRSGGVAVDSGGSIYLFGTFFGAVNFYAATLTSAGGSDVFVLRLDGVDVTWAKQAGGTGNETAGAIHFASNGLLYTTGAFQGTVPLGAGSLVAAGASDVFGAVFDNTGKLIHATSGGGTSSDLGLDIAADSDGRAVIAGTFTGSASFGGTNLSSGGFEEAFVWRYAFPLPTNGIFSHGGTDHDTLAGMVIDAGGNHYVAGYFAGTIAFGSVTLTSAGGTDIFVAKLDSVGNVLWAIRFGGVSDDRANGIARDLHGSLYITGHVGGATTFGATTLTGPGGFVAKLDGMGTTLWARQIGNSVSNESFAIAVSALDHLFVTGNFASTATLGATTLVSAGATDMFIARLDLNGNFVWAKSAGNASTDWSEGLATDSSGNVYVAGHFYSTVSFGATPLTSVGGTDGVVMKLDPSGTFLWATRMGGAGNDYAKRLVVDSSSGEVYVTGAFSGTATMGASTLTSAGSLDVFLAKLNSSGSLQWGVRGGGTGSDEALAITRSASGKIVVVGFLGAGGTFGAFSLSGVGANDVFFVEVNNNGDILRARLAGGVDGDRADTALFDGFEQLVVGGRFGGTATFDGVKRTSAGGKDVFVWRPVP